MKNLSRKKPILPRTAPVRPFSAGTRFVRIVELIEDECTGERRPKFPETSFNPTRVPNNPDARGRFSVAKGWPKREWYSHYYAAEPKLDERVALSEFLERRRIPQMRDGNRKVPQSADILSDFAFLEVRTSKDLQLLDVTNQVNADKVFAEFEVLHGSNFRETRNWGRHFRNSLPNVDGIAYCPTRIKSVEFGCNVVLFAKADDSSDAGIFEETTRLVPVNSDEGMRILYRAGGGLGVVWT